MAEKMKIWLGLGLLVALISLVFFQQNRLLKTQLANQKALLDAEANSLVAAKNHNTLIYLDQALAQVAMELASSPQRVLSDETIDRIANLSSSFEPYVEMGGPFKRSPERANLLFTLGEMRMDATSFSKIKKKVSFSFADLHGRDLSGWDLRGVDLNHADLSGADVRAVNLEQGNLESANLWGVDLSGAVLSGANLKRASLQWAKLNGADLQKADLSSGDLSNAQLNQAILKNARLESANLQSASLIGADLSRADLTAANLRSTNLSGANLHSANLLVGVISDAKLISADLTDANLSLLEFDDEKWLLRLKEQQVIGAESIIEQYSMTKANYPTSTFSLVKK